MRMTRAMDPYLHLKLVRLDVERLERATGMRVRGVHRVPACEFEYQSDWADGVALEAELAEAIDSAWLAARAAPRSASR